MERLNDAQRLRYVDKNTWPPYEEVLRKLGIEGKTPQERVAALRKAPVNELVAASFTGYFGGVWVRSSSLPGRAALKERTGSGHRDERARGRRLLVCGDDVESSGGGEVRSVD